MSKHKGKNINPIKAQLDSVLENKKELEELLHLEKQNRRLSENELVFIGMANIAEYFWCSMKSLYKNRDMELAFFSSYLQDRVSYSARLGLIDELPDNKEKWLEIGDNINFDNIENLLRENTREFESRVSIPWDAEVITGESGSHILVINTDLPQDEIDYYKKQAKSKGIHVVSIDEAPPKVRGTLLEYTKAEQYPKIRWNFPWDKYIVVGVPDGITNEYVYEFKTTRNRFLMGYLKPVALTQADLYGYFFKRSKKRTQIFITEENSVETWDNEVDKNKAISVLTDFKKVEEGISPLPPKAWKCKHCEFAAICILHQN